MKDGKGHVFTNEDVGRIRRAVAWFEKRYRNDKPERGKWPAPGWTGLLPAKNTSGGTVSGGSIASPVSFNGTLLVPSGNGFTVTGGDVMEMWNPYTGTIASNAFMWVTSFNNRIYVATANCP